MKLIPLIIYLSGKCRIMPILSPWVSGISVMPLVVKQVKQKEVVFNMYFQWSWQFNSNKENAKKTKRKKERRGYQSTNNKTLKKPESQCF